MFLTLGDGYADEVEAAKFSKLTLRFRNQEWAERIGLGELTPDEWKRHFGEFQALSGNLQKPLALRYHGHQFRHYNPDLGDGRGFLFAQMRDQTSGRLLDLGTKGSGKTPYSRGGDGKLTLKGAVREALATEMLESLGVNTSKTFSIFETGENLFRNDEPSPTRAAVLVRLSHSHIRFGTLQRLRFEKDEIRITKLVNYCLKVYFDREPQSSAEENALAFLEEVVDRTAELCASWMAAGFVHGVLNTDNMNITGESFDYGPYRFLPHYDPLFTAAYFDQTGLYAYGRQPEAVLWNLEQLATALLGIAEESQLVEALNRYAPQFNHGAFRRIRERLGLEPGEDEEALMLRVYEFLSTSQIGFAQFFHDWYGGLASRERAAQSPEAGKYQGESFQKLHEIFSLVDTSPRALEALKNPYFLREKPCDLLIDEIEWIWEAIDQGDDWSRFENKITEIRDMGRVYGRRSVPNPTS